jgi:hypothetical protein
MEIASYVFGLLAFIAAALAGLEGAFHRYKRAKFFTYTAIAFACMGAVCWIGGRIREGSENTSTTERAATSAVAIPSVTITPLTVPPTPLPSLETPASTPSFTFTSEQISNKLRDSWSSQREEIAKAFEGLRVEWILFFNSAIRLATDPDTMLASFRQKDSLVLVFFRIPTRGNEHFPLTSKTQRYKVRGMIESAEPYRIFLTDATFEPISD